MESMDKSAAHYLRSIIERVERLEEEKANIAADIKDVYAEAKSMGYDCKIIRKLIAERKRQPNEVEHDAQMLDLYRAALGQLDGTPLGHADLSRLTPQHAHHPQ